MNKKRSALIVLLILLIAAAAYGVWHYQQQQDKPLTLYGNVDIRTVNLGFRVDGRLASLTVDEGDAVQPGQLLGKLDDAPYRNALQQAEANVGSARAKLSLLQAGYRIEEIAQVRSEMAQRQSAFAYADSFLKRQQGLWAKNATSADALEDARTARNQAQANLQAAKDKLSQYLSGNRPQEIEQAKADVAQSEAALAQAQLNLQDATLVSPSAGTVLTRAVEPGTMLGAGGTVFTLSLTGRCGYAPTSTKPASTRRCPAPNWRSTPTAAPTSLTTARSVSSRRPRNSRRKASKRRICAPIWCTACG